MEGMEGIDVKGWLSGGYWAYFGVDVIFYSTRRCFNPNQLYL